MKKCMKCNKVYDTDGVFCDQCGSVLSDYIESNENISEIQSNDSETYNKKYQFQKDNIFFTDVELENDTIKIKQYNFLLFFKFNKKNFEFSAYDVKEIISRENISIEAVCFILLGLLVAFNTWMGWIMVGLGFFGLKSKKVYIYYNNSFVVIPDEISRSSQLNDLINYMEKLNPNIVRNK